MQKNVKFIKEDFITSVDYYCIATSRHVFIDNKARVQFAKETNDGIILNIIITMNEENKEKVEEFLHNKENIVVKSYYKGKVQAMDFYIADYEMLGGINNENVF